MPRECWARSFGGCSGGISAEHILSDGLFRGKTVLVSGYPWCKGEPRRIGLASFVQNVLCIAHNSALSPVDQAGITAFRALNPAEGDPSAPSPSEVPVDSLLFERFVLKGVINVMADESSRWLLSRPGETGPPLFFLERVFGRAPITPPMGLYAEDLAGQWLPASDDISVIAHTGDLDRIVGATMVIQGLHFLMWLVPELTPTPEMFEPRKRRLIYRPHDVAFHNPSLGDFRVLFT